MLLILEYCDFNKIFRKPRKHNHLFKKKEDRLNIRYDRKRSVTLGVLLSVWNWVEWSKGS